MGDSVVQTRLFELFVFIGVIAVITGLLSLYVVYSSTSSPPHAGVDVDDSGEYVTVSVTTMGQSDSVIVVVNGNERGVISESSETLHISRTTSETKRVRIVSENGHQTLLLRDFTV